jgi:uncharacterized protein (TIGR04255 family)
MSANKKPNILSKASLVYALAQVKIGAIVNIEKYIPEVQDKLRSLYPRFNETTSEMLKINNKDGSIDVGINKSWEFINKESRTSILLSNNAFTFHTSEYKEHVSFFDDFKEAIELVNATLNISLVERVGLRYIDLIIPDSIDDLNLYVISGVRGIPSFNTNISIDSNSTETVLNTVLGKLLIKYYAYTDGRTFPKDIPQPNLAPPQIIIDRGKISHDYRGILDFDHFCNKSEDYSIDDVMDKLNKLHKDTSTAFKEITTDYAKGKWK